MTSTHSLSLVDRLRLLPTVVRMTASQFREKRRADARCHDGAEPPSLPPAAHAPRWRRMLRRGRNLLAFLQRMRQWNRATLDLISTRLHEARERGLDEIVLYGEGHVAAAVLRCAAIAGVRVIAVCPWGLPDPRVPRSLPEWTEAMLVNGRAAIVVATLANTSRHIDRLTVLGIPRERTIVLE